MTDKEKLQAILSLLTDENVGVLVRDGQTKEGDEAFGALVFASHTFHEVMKIVDSQ